MIRRPASSEDGSMTPWFVIAAGAILLVVGLVLDGGSHLRAQQHAYSVAAQAARTGGQQLDTAAVVAGHEFAVDPTAAVTAAHGYLAMLGTGGDVAIVGDRIQVTVHETYTPQILGMLGLGPFPVEATATARLVRVLGTAER